MAKVPSPSGLREIQSSLEAGGGGVAFQGSHGWTAGLTRGRPSERTGMAH